MPKAHRVAIYEYLFKEGVLVAEKDFYAPKHGELENIPNLHVIKTMQSLKSRNFVKEQFAWRHYYWYLTNEGIEYLRSYLHLPPEIVPSTLKRAQRSEAPRPRGTSKYFFVYGRMYLWKCVYLYTDHFFFVSIKFVAAPRSDQKGGEDRQQYRRAPGADKKADAGAGGADVEFRGGFGRGSRQPPPQ